MKGRTRGRAQRTLLAVLCLLASLGYLTRAAGQPGLTGSRLMSAGTAVTLVAEAARPTSSPHHRHAAPAATATGDAVSASVDPRSAAQRPALHLTGPNAPPSGEHDRHGAHCPFCFTAAFAVAAGLFAVVRPPSPERRTLPDAAVAPAQVAAAVLARGPPPFPFS
ncbi:hypothetical protein LAJ19_19020 (plasmid) [Deinococcus taeanensis]|uniref:hypothetical protein n=1 Tax=Deinococcus taeanensis TaxID=2737050 RepID=UPI001CDCCF2B|nr:hypothetical protein [Deinococcus taeanensis]UBV44883.1 hypothetical protein LAJ19_19020 [Deinococcus taeanensis]